jgi:glycosyltransferase involved in cell wall biosynthesis
MSLRFSVVIPTHYRPVLLERALESVLAQRYDAFEVIVVNDGNDNETNACIDRFCDSRIRVIRHDKALGASASRNRGILEAKGDLVAFLDDDDELSPFFLERHLYEFESDHSLGWTWSGIERRDHGAEGFIEKSVRTIWRTAASDKKYLCQLAASYGVVARTSLLRNISGFDTKMTVAEDIDLFLRLESKGVKCKPIPQELVKIHIHGGKSLSRSSSHTKFVDSLSLLLEKNAKFLDRYPHVRMHYRLSLLGHLYRANLVSQARKLSREVFGCHPFSWAAAGKILRFEFKILARLLKRSRVSKPGGTA